MNIIRTIKSFGAVTASVGFLFASVLTQAQEVLVFQQNFEEEGRQIIDDPENRVDLSTVAEGHYVLVSGGTLETDPRQSFSRRGYEEPGVRTWGGPLREGDYLFMAARMTHVLPRGNEFEGEGLRQDQARIKFPNINIEGYNDLTLRLLYSVGQGPRHEPDDSLLIRVRFDDSDEWYEIGGMKSASSNQYPIYFEGRWSHMNTFADTNKATNFMQEWEWHIPGNGTTMELQMTFGGNALAEDHYMDDVRIYGVPNLPNFTASFANSEVTEPEAGSSIVNNFTITADSAAPAGGWTFDLTANDSRAARSFAIPSGSVVIPEGANSVTVPVEVVQDGIYFGVKTADLIAYAHSGGSAWSRLYIQDSTPRPQLIFTEAMNITPGIDSNENVNAEVGDANNDGVFSRADDLFVELVNIGDFPIDLSYYRIGDDLADRHLVTPGTVLYPNQALVVFSGGSFVGSFGGSVVQIASGGGNGLGMNRGSRTETMYITTPSGEEIDRQNIQMQYSDHERVFGDGSNPITDPNDPFYGFDGVGADDPRYLLASSQSRLPEDLVITNEPYTLSAPHITALMFDPSDDSIPNLPGYRADLWAPHNMVLFLPGFHVSGNYYFEPTNIVTLSIDNTEFREDAGPNAATGTITLANPAPAGGFEVTLETDGVRFDDFGNLVPVKIDLDSTVVVVPGGSTSATFRIGAYDNGLLDGDKTIIINVTNPDPYVIGDGASVRVIDIAESDYDIIINEFFVDAEGTTEDFNLDGMDGDMIGDRFIEIVNRGDRPVNMSGWRIWWSVFGVFSVPTESHRFPEGTWVPAGGSIVVFGSITEEAKNDPRFGGAIVQSAKNPDGSLKRNGLDLNRGNDLSLHIENQYGFTVFADERIPSMHINEKQSANRNPDLVGEDWLPHLEVWMEANPGGFDFPNGSPGLTITMEPFEGNGTVLLPHVFRNSVERVPGTWLSSPVFGGYTPVTPYGHANMWAYMGEQQTFWFVHPVEDGFWYFDVGHQAWLWTSAGAYPGAWNGSAGEWITNTRNR